jgi:hypothetical protein
MFPAFLPVQLSRQIQRQKMTGHAPPRLFVPADDKYSEKYEMI